VTFFPFLDLTCHILGLLDPFVGLMDLTIPSVPLLNGTMVKNYEENYAKLLKQKLGS